MDAIFTDVLNRLSQVPKLRFLGEDWGQLNIEQPPVNFPCALIDLGEVKYSNAGKNTQQAEALLLVTIADVRYETIANFVPQAKNEQAFALFKIMEEVNAVLHGYGTDYHSKLVRVKTEKIMREDSIRQFVMTYKFGFTDETVMPAYTPNPVPPNIEINLH